MNGRGGAPRKKSRSDPALLRSTLTPSLQLSLSAPFHKKCGSLAPTGRVLVKGGTTIMRTLQMTTIVCGLVGLAALTSAGLRADAKPAHLKPKMQCSDFMGKTIPASQITLATKGAEITAAELKPGTGKDVPPADYVPEFCNVEGRILPVDPNAPPILFRVNMPTDWNGNAFQIGGNGMDGFIPNLSRIVRDRPGSPLGPAYPPDRQFPIAQGYATYGSNSGHGEPNAPTPDQTVQGQVAGQARGPNQATPQGPPPGFNFNWMGNRESMKNFAYEQIKKTHDVAMELMVEMYGQKPKINYFTGESQGGREALMAVAHYPEDYDGVLASVPLAFFTGVLTGPAYRSKLQTAPGSWIPPAKAPAISAEVLRQCDELDGLKDGVINNYYACNRLFDPTITPHPYAKLRCANGGDTGNDCLSDAQISVLEAFHAPLQWGFPMANGEAYWPGEPSGSEAQPGYLLSATDPSAGSGGGRGPNGLAMFGLVYANDAGKYDFSKQSLADAKDGLQFFSSLADDPTDWRKFEARGGKLILHSAANDYVTNSRGHMLVYEQAVKRQGQAAVDKFARFYVTPNANHGSVGFSATTHDPQARFMDLLTYLQNWVENGQAPPDVIPQKLMEDKPPYKLIRSRPLCRYPKYPKYNGSGNPDDMASYTCAQP
jgi:hypothetical protein